jgi:hypothetical protein
MVDEVVKSHPSKMPCLDQNTSELLATTGVLPRTPAIHRTTRGTSTSRLVVAAIRITTIRITLLALGVLGVLNKTS